jgi:2-polyprenyl-3-methyl-5-hydroxy-6-metoxy-1,4-benzoquinol methylase
VITAGLSDVDYKWNFEEKHPAIENKIDLIVSQAIFEHLLNPYKHFQDLADIISHNGHIIIHTVMPSFPYHRFPIDALRFFPDWFEECAKRFALKIIRKRIQDGHIFYMFQKR